jgi:hypothetical protein
MRLSISRILLATALGLCVPSLSPSSHAQPMDALAPPVGGGQAAPLPIPAPSTMAQAPADTPPAGQPIAQPSSGPAPAPLVVSALARKDTLTVADLQDKLMATRDALWVYGDALASADLLKQYNERAAKISQVTPALAAP